MLSRGACFRWAYGARLFQLRDDLLGTAPPPVRTRHRRLLSALRAAKVSHKGWTCSAHPCHFVPHRPPTRLQLSASAAMPGSETMRQSTAISEDDTEAGSRRPPSAIDQMNTRLRSNARGNATIIVHLARER